PNILVGDHQLPRDAGTRGGGVDHVGRAIEGEGEQVGGAVQVLSRVTSSGYPFIEPASRCGLAGIGGVAGTATVASLQPPPSP
ncbi:MAG: hypothetical protein ABIR75_12835, partial [Arachnia sp.]